MRLSDFKDEKAIEVVADLLEPIFNIVSNAENAKAKDDGMIKFAGAMLKNSAKDVMSMLAILDDKEPSEYHCNAASVMRDVVNMLSDPELMQLFGLQRQTQTSAGSASEITEVENQ